MNRRDLFRNLALSHVITSAKPAPASDPGWKDCHTRDGREFYRHTIVGSTTDGWPLARWVPVLGPEIKPGDHILIIDFVAGELNTLLHVRVSDRPTPIPDAFTVDMIEGLLPPVRS